MRRNSIAVHYYGRYFAGKDPTNPMLRIIQKSAYRAEKRHGIHCFVTVMSMSFIYLYKWKRIDSNPSYTKMTSAVIQKRLTAVLILRSADRNGRAVFQYEFLMIHSTDVIGIDQKAFMTLDHIVLYRFWKF